MLPVLVKAVTKMEVDKTRCMLILTILECSSSVCWVSYLQIYMGALRYFKYHKCTCNRGSASLPPNVYNLPN